MKEKRKQNPNKRKGNSIAFQNAWNLNDGFVIFCRDVYSDAISLDLAANCSVNYEILAAYKRNFPLRISGVNRYNIQCARNK